VAAGGGVTLVLDVAGLAMNRREFLAMAAAAARPQGTILVHEHVLVDFTGGTKYDEDEAFRAARPKLREVQALGCRRLQEATPDFVGRNPRLLARLQDAVGMEIWTNTGLYAAANFKYVPPFAREESAEQLARRWIAEARQGVDGVKPRFIKIGVNRGPLTGLEKKLARAAAITTRETGLTIASHTGNGIAALEQIEIVTGERLTADKFVWVHAQSEKDHAFHEKAARAGAWVEFDGIRPNSADWHLQCVRHMAARDLLGRTLVSQDSGWYRVGEPGGGEYRPYTYLYTDFLPRLESGWAGVLLIDNPVRAYGK
jgi:phosphotriesterase-related protein